MKTLGVTENEQIDRIFLETKELLKKMIAIPSFSKEEDRTAEAIEHFLQGHDIPVKRYLNNVWAVNQYFDEKKLTILLNSHHDTVKPNAGYTLPPFEPIEKEGKLYGLGSNDAGGPLVGLIGTFLFFYSKKDLPFNLVIAATAEEEISGHDGIEILLPRLPRIDCGIVGEPTLMKMAIAEKGLLVIDCIAHGAAGHAARNEGVNAVYKAMKDIQWFSSWQFAKDSKMLGPVHMAVTSIYTDNKAHNIVPSQCRFVVDIRVNERYTFEEVIAEIRKHITSEVLPRSTRLRPSFIAESHPLVKAGQLLGVEAYGSPTCSDRALMDFPALKMGPGDSARSHSANEFIFTDEILKGIQLYVQLLLNI